jgi:4-hydroxy-3-methylbut-2-enyl diphosphate reductase
MEIIYAKHAGFCEGVERAYRIALKAVEKKKPLYILGDLVHNRDVVGKFKKLGIRKVKDAKGISAGSTLIITAHGASPEIFDQAKKRGLHVVDTTCPWVRRAQELALRLSKSGRRVVIVGDKGHPEVAGLLSWAGGGAVVVEKKKDVGRYKFNEKVGVIAQTTQSNENFSEVVAALRKRVSDISVHNTICGATSKRQCAATDLAGSVDLMLVIGDFKSANTNRLTELCRSVGVPTKQIQNERELKSGWFKGKVKIGVTAGASTPDWIIKKIVRKIKQYGKKN